VLHIDGIYTQAAAGKLQIELGGTTAGTNYDQLLVSGAVSLAGTLQVSLINSFSPAVGNSFDILDWGSRSGRFSSLELPPLAAGLMWNASQLYTNGILSVTLVGDYNGNGVVDAADYTVWRDTLGQSGSGLAADGDGNGVVDSGDYDVWKTNFGQHAGSGTGASANAAVPEPSTWALLMFGAAGSRLRRRRGA